MDDEASNDIEAVEIDSQDEDDPDGAENRPIMLLLRRLIRNKQNTVMTNAQIIDILQSEFNISVNSSHELEVDIYIKIIKKYLKDWPQWEELERISTKLSNVKDFAAVTKVLDHKYKNLKEYLGAMLEAAKPLAKEALKNIETDNIRNEENIDQTDVVMEILCTRQQLNHLFFRCPRTDLNNTVFNMSPVEPSRILLKTLPFEDILNVWWLKIEISLPYFTFIREVIYKFKHTLVNKVRNEGYSQDISLDTDLYAKPVKKPKEYEKKEIYKQFSDILQGIIENSEMYSILHSIFNVLTCDLEETLIDIIRVPGNYRRYANKYKYVRYLYAENEQSTDPRYDLQLEETIAPTYQFYIGKMGKYEKPSMEIGDWLKIDCMLCKVKFPVSVNLQQSLEAHFSELHRDEPNWHCMHCSQTFTVDDLAKRKWRHNC